MRTIYAILPALLAAGAALAQGDGRPDPRQPQAKARPVEFRSSFEGYRSYAEPELLDWRKTNDEVRSAAAKAPPAKAHEGLRK